MKKAFSVLAVFFLLFAAGCEKQKTEQATPPCAPTSFTSKIKAVWNGIEMTAELTQNAAEDFTLQFLTPQALSPLSLTYQNGLCSVKYNDLMFETELDRFPQAEMGALIIHSISDAVQGIDIQTTCSDRIWTYTGTGERGAFSLTRNAETGEWIELNVEGAKLKVNFSDFKVK